MLLVYIYVEKPGKLGINQLKTYLQTGRKFQERLKNWKILRRRKKIIFFTFLWTLKSKLEKPEKMAKLENLPDEVILKVFNNLQIPDILRCGRVSKRIKEISNDETLWQKINLFNKRVTKGFLSRIIANNCKYLSLNEAVLGNPLDSACRKLELDLRDEKSKLIYLDLSWCKSSVADIEVILGSCHCLEKLSLADIKLTSSMISSICRGNAQTLQSLNLDFCKGLDLGSVQNILNRCVNLNELNFRNTRLSDETEKYLAENLPSSVEKLDLSSLNFNDQYIRLVHGNCPRYCGLRSCRRCRFQFSLKHCT